MTEQRLIKTINSLLAFASIMMFVSITHLPPFREQPAPLIASETETEQEQEPEAEPRHFYEAPEPTPNPALEYISVNLRDVFDGIKVGYTAPELTYIGRGYITAYCNCSKCCTYANQATASGIYPHYEKDPWEPTTVAIDPRYFRFGDLFQIDGKLYTAEDTGSAVKGYHWDVFKSDHSEVQSFDSHYTSVYKVTYKTEEGRKVNFNGYFNFYLLRGSLRGRFICRPYC